METGYEDVWRESTPHVLAALVRRYGDFAAAEDALQEALLAAARQWPADGTPANPRGWLIRVASRRLVDARRSDRARAGREAVVVDQLPADELVSPAADAVGPNDGDDSLALLVLCCHPALSRPSQVALTLRAVAGLGTDRIARAFLVPESTMAQRISRAKARLRQVDEPFGVPPAAELPERVASVAHVLYLIFTEGHTATVGAGLHRRLPGPRGDPADPPSARPAARRERGDRPAGADAAHRLPARGAHRRRGIAGAARPSRTGHDGTGP